jgi:SAM-dependent methyltransferase
MPIGLYSDALVYDILHAEGTAREVKVLERIEKKWVCAPLRGEDAASSGTPSVWLEPACGTGRYLRAAAARGKRVIGFDRSKEMVAFARERLGPGAKLFAAEMTDFAARVGTAKVDLAFNPINTIRHLQSDRAMLRHFQEIARVLRPRGVYVVGISISSYGNEFEAEDVWSGRRGGLWVKQVVQYIPPARRGDRSERVHSHLVVTREGREEHRDSRYSLRCYDRGQWESLIGRSALTVVGVVDEAGRPARVRGAGYVVYVLRRRDAERAAEPAIAGPSG